MSYQLLSCGKSQEYSFPTEIMWTYQGIPFIFLLFKCIHLSQFMQSFLEGYLVGRTFCTLVFPQFTEFTALGHGLLCCACVHTAWHWRTICRSCFSPRIWLSGIKLRSPLPIEPPSLPFTLFFCLPQNLVNNLLTNKDCFLREALEPLQPDIGCDPLEHILPIFNLMAKYPWPTPGSCLSWQWPWTHLLLPCMRWQ